MRATEELRRRWIEAARIYYLSPGDDSGMTDSQWDAAARVLYRNRHLFPHCPILSDPEYAGGSLFWVRRGVYEAALAARSGT